MPKCSFCKQDYEFPRGLTIVQKDGSVKYMCSSKCRKNANRRLHLRKKRKIKWVLKQKKITPKVSA